MCERIRDTQSITTTKDGRQSVKLWGAKPWASLLLLAVQPKIVRCSHAARMAHQQVCLQQNNLLNAAECDGPKFQAVALRRSHIFWVLNALVIHRLLLQASPQGLPGCACCPRCPSSSRIIKNSQNGTLFNWTSKISFSRESEELRFFVSAAFAQSAPEPKLSALSWKVKEHCRGARKVEILVVGSRQHLV